METACWKVQILARLRDHRGAIRKIMERIAGLAAADRETALAQLLILARLRRSGWRASCVVPTCCSGTARSIFARWMETACWKVQILARLRDHRGAIRKIMERIAG